MAYDHGKKAGNRGDVWKHAVLVSIASRLNSGTITRYLESHSGAPLHDLMRGGEWNRGVMQCLAAETEPSHPYLSIANRYVEIGQYPAGWVFFAAASFPRFIKIHLCDTSDSVAAQYGESTPPTYPTNVNAQFMQSDGFAAAQEAREGDIVFLDPPFSPNPKADWNKIAQTCEQLVGRGIPFMVWYPFYWHTHPMKLVNRTQQIGWEVHWSECGPKPSQNLKGCGMLVSDTLRPLLEQARVELTSIARLLRGNLRERVPDSTGYSKVGIHAQ